MHFESVISFIKEISIKCKDSFAFALNLEINSWIGDIYINSKLLKEVITFGVEINIYLKAE